MRYTALIREERGKYLARVPALPDCVAEGATRDEALANVTRAVAAALNGAEAITIEVDAQNCARSVDPWLKGRGMLADDPDFDEVLNEMTAYRRNARSL